MKGYIYEGNLERLQKHVNRIAKKAVRYGNEAVSMTMTGAEEFREIKHEDGNVAVHRFVEVDVTGEAHCDGWRFVATLEHLEGGENVIRRYDQTAPAVPDRYRTAEPVCEHCLTRRRRKDTYLVYNEDDDTWMQVGKSCLRDLTGGLSAEDVARWISLWDDVVSCEAPGDAHGETWFELDEILTIASAVIRVRGFVPTRDEMGVYNPESTREIVLLHWHEEHGGLSIRGHREMMDRDRYRGYKENPADAVSVKAWAEGLSGSEYSENLRTLCRQSFIRWRDLGLVVSAPYSMVRDEERARERRAEAERRKREAASSQWAGAVGERIRIPVDHVRVLTSYETVYGTMFVNGIWDKDGNAYIWKTSRTLSDNVETLIGTVKAHGEFRGVKQTELSRCKVDEGGKK